ncbi:MAG: hypothetical protein WAU83_18565, partial [Pseudonocardiaceae bacterium]
GNTDGNADRDADGNADRDANAEADRDANADARAWGEGHDHHAVGDPGSAALRAGWFRDPHRERGT